MMADVGVRAWHEPAELFIDNADTLAPCDLLLVVRSNTAFDGDTLTLRIGVLTPDSLRCEESLLLSVPRGGSAAVARETQTVYRRNVVLADSGPLRLHRRAAAHGARDRSRGALFPCGSGREVRRCMCGPGRKHRAEDRIKET